MIRDLKNRPDFIVIDDLEDCPHDEKRIKVLETWLTCELTVLVCGHCKKELEKPKTEC